MTFADIRKLPTLAPTFQIGSRIAACVERILAARGARRAERALIEQLRKLDAHQLSDLGIDAAALQSMAPRIMSAKRSD